MISRTSDRTKTIAICAALILATVATYWPVTGHEFLNWDDGVHVYENDYVRSGLTWRNFVWSWGIHGPSQWHPLAWWSHQLDCQLFGAGEQAAARHHASNLLWHTLAVVVLFLALRRLTSELWPSAMVSALFALHPLSVESVAWISERRDVLSALFLGLTLWAYAAYAQRGGPARFALVVVTFALGLMAKPMLVTLPCVLLLLDYWPLRRVVGLAPASSPSPEKTAPCPQKTVTWLILEKLPLLVLSAVSIWLSYRCQQVANTISSLEHYPLSARLANAVLSYVLYLRNMLWPCRLGPLYSLPGSFVRWQVASAALALLAATAVAVGLARRRPYLLVGWLWYLGMLLPVIGLLRMGTAVSMADRWVYLPLIGIFLAMVWGLRDVVRAWPAGRWAAAAVMVVVLVACAMLTRRQITFWQDSITLFTRAIDIDPNVPVAYNNLGTALQSQKRFDEAINHYQQALKISPKLAHSYNNWGTALAEQGLFDQAIVQYQKALEIKPNYAEAHYNWGNALVSLGRAAEGLDHFEEALRINPNYVEAHCNRGNALASQKRFDEAVSHYKQAVEIKPDCADAHNSWGNALLGMKRYDDAVVHYLAALRIKPDYSEAHSNLAWLLATCPDASKRDGPQALDHAKQAVDIAGENNPSILDSLAAAYAEAGDFSSAVHWQQKALQLAPAAQKAEFLARLEMYRQRQPYREGK